ncbi:MAG: TGS domain-containing protein, partial [Candidatus Kariarchaeaceae archaeon]
ADRGSANTHIGKLRERFSEENIVSTSGLAELTLRKADQSELIKYTPGSIKIDFLGDTENPSKMMKIVMAIDEKLFAQKESTGVAKLLEICVFDILNLIAVFPVEDSSHFTDHDGRILPDVFLVPKGTNAKEFAGKIHTDLQNTFINGILVNDNNKRISATHELENLDIIKIIAAQK